jgi:endoglucanase
VYMLFVEAAVARPGLAAGAGLSVNLTGWQGEAERYFDRIVQGNLKNGYLTKGQLVHRQHPFPIS